ncbi:MAG: DNA-3-methyladenine glycosylase [Chloroflexota bacterium]|nr:DNA-3-methyladenine glycosylase [Chloroflexota bacterium]
MSALQRDFYDRPALDVARDLLGCRLMRIQSGARLAGLILETEAYQGEEDLGCHASAGRTPRTAVMYGPPGHAYVYFTYGMHWLLNAVTDSEGTPAAVLIRAMLPVEGFDRMAVNRPYKAGKRGWTDGPAKLTQVLAVDKTFNTLDLCTPDSGLWIEPGQAVPDNAVERSARIGLNSVPEPWRSIPWRFEVAADVFQK